MISSISVWKFYFEDPYRVRKFFLDQDIVFRTLMCHSKQLYHSEYHYLRYFLESHEKIFAKLDDLSKIDIFEWSDLPDDFLLFIRAIFERGVFLKRKLRTL